MSYDIVGAVGLNTGSGNPAVVWRYMISANYFDSLGIQPYLGRFIHGSDERGKNSVPYIVLSYAYWRTQFNSDRNVVAAWSRSTRIPTQSWEWRRPIFAERSCFSRPICGRPLWTCRRWADGIRDSPNATSVKHFSSSSMMRSSNVFRWSGFCIEA